jgi:hypothetical protein
LTAAHPAPAPAPANGCPSRPTVGTLAVIYADQEIQEIVTGSAAQVLQIKPCQHDAQAPCANPRPGQWWPQRCRFREKASKALSGELSHIRAQRRQYQMLNCAPITQNAPESPRRGADANGLRASEQPCSVLWDLCSHCAAHWATWGTPWSHSFKCCRVPGPHGASVPWGGRHHHTKGPRGDLERSPEDGTGSN